MVCFILFFFFKQKTAYEMRISDWSSDVCSSDLHHLCLAESNGLVGSIANFTGAVLNVAPQSDVADEAKDNHQSQWNEAVVEIVPSVLATNDRSDRSEERRGGKECVSTCRSRWSPYH